MSNVPQVKSAKLSKFYIKRGFLTRKGKGSHLIHFKGDISISIPMHNTVIGKGLLLSILKQSKVSLQELKDNL